MVDFPELVVDFRDLTAFVEAVHGWKVPVTKSCRLEAQLWSFLPPVGSCIASPVMQ